MQFVLHPEQYLQNQIFRGFKIAAYLLVIPAITCLLHAGVSFKPESTYHTSQKWIPAKNMAE